MTAGGAGVVTGERLYQPIWQRGAIADRILRIQFPGPAVDAYAFTYG